MQLLDDLPGVEYTLMYLHEGLNIWSRLMQETFAKCNIINLREILRTEGIQATQMLTPTLSRVIQQSLTPGDPVSPTS